jgi:F0F1-type ATP synthase assembly protein I
MKLPSMQIVVGIALGAGIGAVVALIIGTGAAWLAVGIAVGIGIGAAMSRRKIEGTPTSPGTGKKWGTDLDWS